jgi:hypothetical protein
MFCLGVFFVKSEPWPEEDKTKHPACPMSTTLYLDSSKKTARLDHFLDGLARDNIYWFHSLASTEQQHCNESA